MPQTFSHRLLEPDKDDHLKLCPQLDPVFPFLQVLQFDQENKLKAVDSVNSVQQVLVL